MTASAIPRKTRDNSSCW